jgi:hypothetical protein
MDFTDSGDGKCALWRRYDINLCNAKHLSSLAIFCAELLIEFVEHGLSGKTTSDRVGNRHPDDAALHPKADMDQHDRDVRFVPKADVAALFVRRSARGSAAKC